MSLSSAGVDVGKGVDSESGGTLCNHQGQLMSVDVCWSLSVWLFYLYLCCYLVLILFLRVFPFLQL